MTSRPPTRDDLRIGDAERDAVMVALHDHFAAGRLDRGELDERLETALTAKTRGDLRGIVHDLPGPTGIAEPEPPEALDQGPWGPGPWGPGAALMFGGPGRPGRWHHHRHPAYWHGHPAHRRGHRHGPRFAVFPAMLGVFLALAFTVGPGAGLLAVLQIALVVWVVRTLVVAFGARRSRRQERRRFPGA
ncbi:DUF1707 SHOCT-like domain-containing protein [Actinomadura rubrisoli]|uniref:DUF1707 domain-containing protein n=1 Tax=Actinomadura rubrisoli TaxID=2530368 RepID=A0A4R5BI14_9ACTN|nr:DUF1707 domain-containing protein [Actinomadura rubrisoli]TDD85149.1 DUF1707 domain-containing protein [Actinomadura rubrisoli]